MTVDLKPLIERALSDARETVLSGEDYMRRFYAADDAGRLHIVMAPCDGPDADAQLIPALRIMFMAWGITQYAMVAETWVSDNPRYSRGNGELPEHDPQRGEAITAIATRRLRGESGALQTLKALARCKITREPTQVGAIEWPDFKSLGGTMFMLLPPDGIGQVSLELRTVARQLAGRLGHSVGELH